VSKEVPRRKMGRIVEGKKEKKGMDNKPTSP
jgi:hypothetical protein